MRATRENRRGLCADVPQPRGKDGRSAMGTAATLLVGLLSLLSVGAAYAADAPAAWLGASGGMAQVWQDDAKSPAQLGQVTPTDWTVGIGATGGQATLPGGVGTVRTEVPAGDFFSVGPSSHFVGAQNVQLARMTNDNYPNGVNPVTGDCLSVRLWDQSPLPSTGFTKSCGTRTLTVTFDRPTADPVIWLAGTYVRPVPVAGTVDPLCYVTWNNATVKAVDGASPAADRVSLASTAGSLVSFNGGKASHDYTADPVSCAPFEDNPRGYPGVRVDGLVSSVTIELEQMVKITKMSASLTGIPRLALAQPTFNLTVSTDVVDLGVEVSAPATVAPGQVFDWTVTATNASAIGSHGFIVKGAVPADVTDASLVSAPAGCSLSGRDLLCPVAPAGWSVSQDASMSTLANLTLAGGSTSVVDRVLAGAGVFGPITLRGKAPVEPGAQLTTTASVSGVDSDLVVTNNTAQAVTTVDGPVWSVAKSVATPDGVTYPAPGDTLTYTVTATSTTGDVGDVVLTDDLTSVLAHADVVPGSTVLTVGSAAPVTLADPTAVTPVLTAGPFTLLSGETATLTYQVVVKEGEWSADLVNAVTAAGSGLPQTCAAGEADPDPSCSTETTTSARLGLVKQGDVDGVVTGLDGAAFELLADDAGQMGAVLTTHTPAGVAGQVGAFEVLDLVPGTYWLRETKAPAGYELLASAVKFTVAADGVVTIVDAGDAPQVVAAGGTITVTDSPAFRMPETGSSGNGPLVAVGAVLLTAALAVAFFSRGRKATRTSAPSSHERGRRTSI